MKVFYFLLWPLLVSNALATGPSLVDFTFNLGPSLSQGGSVDKLGTPNVMAGLGFNFYVVPNHGLGASINNESSFSGTEDTPGIKDASITTFDLHYTYRHIKNKFQIVFEPGLGWQTLFDGGSDPYWGSTNYDNLSSALIFNYKLLFRYVLKEWDQGAEHMTGSFFLGAGVIQVFSFNDSYHGTDLSGNRLAALFQLGLGL